MKEDREKWMKDVFDSMKDSQRAKPNADLFAKIERQLNAPETKIIPMRLWSSAVAAAVLVLVLNVFAFSQFTQNSEMNADEMIELDGSSQSLISNFKIYE